MQNNQNILSAFHGDQNEKQYSLEQVHNWLHYKMMPLSVEEIVNKLTSQIRSYKPSECILENYELFPDKLGLPLWLSNLLRTINHHNSDDFDFSNGNHYETYFYEQFISACNTGVDYTSMLYKWELFLLTDLLPENQRDSKYIKSAIQLYQKASSGIKIDVPEFISLSREMESIMNTIDKNKNAPEEIILQVLAAQENVNAFRGTWNPNLKTIKDNLYHLMAVKKAYENITWNSYRVAFLSFDEVIDAENVWTSSSEALVDAIWDNALITGTAYLKNEKETRRNIWHEIMNQLLKMLKDWQ